MGRLSRTLFFGALGLAAYYAVFGGRYSVFEIRSAVAQQAELAADLEALEAVNAGLEARIDSLENDPYTLERVAREEYGMVMPGERLYRPSEGPGATDGTGPERP